MSALHQAVARAIADADAPYYGDAPAPPLGEYAPLAAAAVGVCLAEARRAVEALVRMKVPGAAGVYGDEDLWLVSYDAALAVLAALAEDTA